MRLWQRKKRKKVVEVDEMRLYGLPKIIDLQTYINSRIVDIEFSKSEAFTFIKAVKFLPSLNQISTKEAVKENELVFLYEALNEINHSNLKKIDVGFVYKKNYAKKTTTALKNHGYILSLLALKVSSRFNCFTGEVTHGLFYKMFYRAADMLSRRLDPVPAIYIGSYLWRTVYEYPELTEYLKIHMI